MNITVLFYGELTEITLVNIKHYRDVRSFTDLLFRLEDDFPGLIHQRYYVSVNNRILSGKPLLNDGDEVSLIPRTPSMKERQA